MGFILNKVIDGISLSDVWKNFSKFRVGNSLSKKLVFIGGPLNTSSMFVIHTADYRVDKETLSIDSKVSVTGSNKIISDIEKGLGPKQLFFSMGYSGWAPGQLEEELTKDSWFICPSDTDLIFKENFDQKWKEAFNVLGIDPARIVWGSGST
jgi:putative transcriptional regulator